MRTGRRTGDYGIRPRRRSTLLRLDIGRPDHLAPLLGFVPDQLAEVSRRARKWRAAQIGKPRLDLGIRERGVDLLVEPVDDLGRRGLGRGDSPPVTGLITRHEVGHGGYVRQYFRTRRRGNREGTHLLRLDVFDGRRDGGEDRLHLSTDE